MEEMTEKELIAVLIDNIIPRRISDIPIGLPPFYVPKKEHLKITKFYIKPIENTGNSV